MGGFIYLNGIGIDEKLFNCINWMVCNYFLGFYFKRSVIMKGFEFILYVLCVEGIYFEGDFMENCLKFKMMVILFGIVFKGIFINF